MTCHLVKLVPYRGVYWLQPTWAPGADYLEELLRKSGSLRDCQRYIQGETEL